MIERTVVAAKLEAALVLVGHGPLSLSRRTKELAEEQPELYCRVSRHQITGLVKGHTNGTRTGWVIDTIEAAIGIDADLWTSRTGTEKST